MASKKKIEAKAEAPSEKTVFPTALYAPGMVIGYESTTELQHLEATLAAEHRPTSPTERSLVDSIVHYEWLLRRYRLARNRSLEGLLEEPLHRGTPCFSLRFLLQRRACNRPPPPCAPRHPARPARNSGRTPPRKSRQSRHPARRLSSRAQPPPRSRAPARTCGARCHSVTRRDRPRQRNCGCPVVNRGGAETRRKHGGRPPSAFSACSAPRSHSGGLFPRKPNPGRRPESTGLSPNLHSAQSSISAQSPCLCVSASGTPAPTFRGCLCLRS